MSAPFKIAFGNLREHKSKTLILVLLITIGVAIIVLGNSFLNAAKRGLEKDMRENYTADIFIHGNLPEKDAKSFSISMFGATTFVMVGTPPKTPSIADLNPVLEKINSMEGVDYSTTVISGVATVKSGNVPEDYKPPKEEKNPMPFTYFMSVDNDSFQKVFPNFTLEEGSWPSKDNPSILVDSRIKDKYKKYYKEELKVGQKVILNAFGGNSVKIREVTVCGFYSQPNPSSVMFELSFLDQTTARGIENLTYGSVYARDLPSSVDTSISNFTEEDLFSSTDMDTMFEVGDDTVYKENYTEDSIDKILGDTTLRDKLNTADDGAWHFIYTRVKNQNDTNEIIEKLNTYFKENNLNMSAETWEKAATPFLMTTEFVNGIFTVLVIILAVVVFIIIMNTVVVSVIERTSEIGTMRALGASRMFIRKMFFIEAVSISIISSIIGVVLALIIIFVVNQLKITIDNDTAKMLLGGGMIQMLPSLKSILGTVLVIVFGNVVANFYPVSLALKITPLKAMNQET